ncbi:MAG: bifunctional riboflavin kinase/FAD synthetase [Bacteroidetes bacterium SW_4_67_19]|nr:MAG: bifunctional riboflavin kinase/FAD synthetase [Bacteroidetes bacterium SW_4_67_19]
MRREIRPNQIARDPASVVTVGTFDGVHVGHQAVVRYLIERAEAQDGPATVLSFDPHPRTVLTGEEVPLLTTPAERADLLEDLGLDRFVLMPFTEEFSQIEAPDYVRDVLVGQVGMQEIVIGYDHGFGKGRAGDADLLKKMAPEYDFAVDVISAQNVEGYGVAGSSAVRRVLAEEGDARQAEATLGRPYAVSGVVERGAGRGQEIGFPTANVHPGDARKLVPKVGVYAARVVLEGETERRPAMVNIGRRPTFDEDEVRLEAHLIGFEGDLYGRQVRVEFAQRLRGERRFDGPDALAEQLSRDEARCKEVLSKRAPISAAK